MSFCRHVRYPRTSRNSVCSGPLEQGTKRRVFRCTIQTQKQLVYCLEQRHYYSCWEAQEKNQRYENSFYFKQIYVEMI